MNYLAHLFLADYNYDSIVGNFIADFIKGPIPHDIPEQISAGIVLHRKIDQFTDHHPIVKKAKYAIDERYGRYRGIMLDVFYDYFLAMNFFRYSDQSLEDFSSFVFYSFLHNWKHLPDQVRKITPNMIKMNWLMGYRDMANIGKALQHLAKRSKRAPDMRFAVDELAQKIKMIEDSFLMFFPDLIEYSEDLKSDIMKESIIQS